jgi:hypothetical protein
VATVDWDAASLAGAFVLGAVIAVVATLHLVRTIFGMRKDRDRD